MRRRTRPSVTLVSNNQIVNSSATTTVRFLESLKTTSNRLSVSTTSSMIVAESARLHVSQLQAQRTVVAFS